ncbi:MAG: M3 family metallopeptidase [Acidobacteriota bacterium]
MRWSWLVMLISLCLPLLASAGDAFDPLPGDQRRLYRFDLARNFYADRAAWQADVDRAKALIGRVESYRGKLLDGPESLLAVMELQRDLEDLTTKLYAYGEFRAAVNTSDREAYEAYQRLMADLEARTSFIRVELLGLTESRLKALEGAEPRLSSYRYLLEETVRMGPHTLSEREESLLASLGPDLTAWQPVLFQKAFDRYPFPSIRVGEKSLNVHSDFETLIRNPDRSIRERAFRQYYDALRQSSDLAGFGLLREMKAYNEVARLRGFPTYYDETLFERFLTRPQILNLFGQIEKRLALYRAYQEWRMKEVEAQTGVARAEIWDMELPPDDLPQPRTTADQAVGLVEESLAVLGPEYSADLRRLLDPRHGSIDIAGGPGRGQGAFTEGNLGFFMDNFQGYLGDASTIAHESGHAVHYQLVKDHRGSLLFARGPSYMTESFAMFNEWLLRDHLLKTAKDPALREMVRRDSLNEMMYLWELARRAKFEMVAYDRVAAGEITDERGFDKACEDTGRLYDSWFQRYPELEVHWMRKHHYWTVPTYYVNYVLAHLLALKYYQLYLEDPAGFAPRYVAMVENGFPEPAAEILKKSLGIHLGDPDLLAGTFALIQKRFDEERARGASPAG